MKGLNAKQVRAVALLGGPAALKFKGAAGGVTVQLPEVPANLMAQPAWVLHFAQ